MKVKLQKKLLLIRKAPPDKGNDSFGKQNRCRVWLTLNKKPETTSPPENELHKCDFIELQTWGRALCRLNKKHNPIIEDIHKSTSHIRNVCILRHIVCRCEMMNRWWIFGRIFLIQMLQSERKWRGTTNFSLYQWIHIVSILLLYLLS